MITSSGAFRRLHRAAVVCLLLAAVVLTTLLLGTPAYADSTTTVRGTVVNEVKGRRFPLTYASISITDKNKAVHTSYTDGAGLFSFQGIPPGPCTITITKYSYSVMAENRKYTDIAPIVLK